jgi:hypothetical protein
VVVRRLGDGIWGTVGERGHFGVGKRRCPVFWWHSGQSGHLAQDDGVYGAANNATLRNEASGVLELQRGWIRITLEPPPCKTTG